MNVRSIWRREMPPGARVPRGWRLAWYLPRRRLGVYFPWPLHRLARWLREVRHRVRAAWRAPTLECLQIFEMQRVHQQRLRLADEYARGYLAGWRECFQTCLAAVEDELTRPDDVWEIGALLSDPPPNRESN